jgi:hypothetical protein
MYVAAYGFVVAQFAAAKRAKQANFPTTLMSPAFAGFLALFAIT